MEKLLLSKNGSDAGNRQERPEIELGALTGGPVDDECVTKTHASTSNETESMADALCPICLDPYESPGALPESPQHLKYPIRIDSCGHTACAECFLEYCKFRLSIHEVPIPCPMSGTLSRDRQGCRGHLPPSIVERVLALSDSDSGHNSLLLVKFQRLTQLHDNALLVSCTRCHAVVVPPPEVGSGGSGNADDGASDEDRNRRSCPSCKHVFCAVHGDAHPNKSCDEYMKEKRPADEFIPQCSKPCSHCGAWLNKFAGCDHVVCPACHGDMCYKCGTHIFLTGKVTRFCSRCQQGYLDHRYVWWIRFYYCLVLPLALPFIIVYMAVAAVAVIATMCCVGAFCCGSNVTTDHSFDPLRGVAYVGWITLLPISGILYDMGIHGFFLEDFVRWFLDEEDGSNRLSGETNHSHILPIREIPTAVSTVDSTASAL